MADVLELNPRSKGRRRKKIAESRRLKADLAKAEHKIDDALGLVGQHIATLNNRQRHSLPKPRGPFVVAARRLVEAVQSHPQLATAARFDERSVVASLDAVDSVSGLHSKAEALARLLGDGKIVWLAQAFDASRSTYAMAKAGAQTDGTLRTVVDALAPAFARRRPAKKPTPAS